METSLYHLEIVVAPENLAFYRDLLPFLGWKTLHDSDEVVGYGSSSGASLWFTPRANGAQNDYDGAGMNHLGFGASSQAEVDEVAAWLPGKGIAPAFDTPRHRPEFSGGDDSTYYQVMFETPDRILIEVVYTGPKQ
ncbi:MAG TPA: hypothetical protein PKA49_10540 [Tepidiformaceae bacterium]|nr:hypothetical protein [Tepidiformaceae bacterium]